MTKNSIDGSVKLTKTCKYCGSTNRQFSISDNSLFGIKYAVECKDCMFRTKRYKKPIDAILEWNKRDDE